MTSAAYLLFYRRRSDEPLGGPKFHDILERYETRAQEAEDSDSGEGQRLGHGSSPRGSSSALQTGAGATLRNGKGGLGRAQAIGLGQQSGDGDELELPDYGAALGNVAEGDLGDAEAEAGPDGLPGLQQWQPRRSIEQDEGISMLDWDNEPRRSSGNISDAVRGTWSFEALQNSGPARSEADDNDSITAQNDTSSLDENMGDEEASAGGYPATINIEPMLQSQDLPEPGADYVLPDEPTVMYEAPPPYEDPSMSSIDITADEIAAQVGHAEHVDRAATEERVTEIHIDDDDKA